MDNPYKTIEAEVIDITEETAAIKTFIFKPKEEFSFRTGQFVELAIPGFGEAPFTPSSNPSEKEYIGITIMNTGRVTKKLHELRLKDKVGIRGPYGKGYPLGEFKGKEVLIVGGGVGLAPLRSLLYALFNEIASFKKIILKYGAKTPKDIVYKKEIEEWSRSSEKVDVKITVDVGDETWKGRVGLVTTLLDNLEVDIKNSVAIVCGPPIMMKFATFKLINIGYAPQDIYLSMEKNMSCGIGKCGHCRMGKYYVCKDGPVFTYDKLKDLPEVWD
ncbi:MAG: oxidoreductase [Candidatus Omnitrophica bacterium CG07_land_8_20_14_0_80_42_15]|uniref:Oxidoreductase n=1 Tax=Candidatus Aquitaenariimonas noxiae TaxID=1974741 RepID=A0A2J0KT88_9BACT|nr:MAG: oxidoreductase [Candidatus Omnitrophica bacterium CG07_land_8_20_14_0_80_42_15]